MTLDIKVVPKSSKTEMAGQMADGTLKIKVAAVPEKGKANLELREFLAGHYGVSASRVQIVSGEKSTRKRVQIDGI